MKAAISIDIGGTFTKLAIINAGYEILGRGKISTQGYSSYKEYFDSIYNNANRILGKVGLMTGIKGIGVGAPSSNTKENTIQDAANVPFLNKVSITEALHERFGLPAFLINDGNAAALGEGLKGTAKGLQNYVLITLGTGLGCGVVVGGQVVTGYRGMAGEFGHVIALKGGRQCGCGAFGCLETYASANGLKRTVFELLAKMETESQLRSYTFDELTAKKVYELALADDPIAKQAFKKTGEILGEKLADLITLFEPEAVILSGGLAQAGALILKPTIEGVYKNILPIYRSTINIQISSLAVNEAALIGAASLVFNSKN